MIETVFVFRNNLNLGDKNYPGTPARVFNWVCPGDQGISPPVYVSQHQANGFTMQWPAIPWVLMCWMDDVMRFRQDFCVVD